MKYLAFCSLFLGLIFFFHGKPLTHSPFKPSAIDKEAIDPIVLKSRLEKLPEERLKKMTLAAEKLQDLQDLFEKEDVSPLDFLMKSEKGPYFLSHYPRKDIVDIENQTQYYFHAHRDGEYGHFHLFTYYPIPSEKNPDDTFAHLVAISVDEKGNPIRLFLTNQWVTDEYAYSYHELCQMVDHFKVEKLEPSWALNDWINQLVVLFYPQIIDLMQKRSEIDTWKDRKTEVLAETPISIDLQIEKLKEITP